MPDPTLSPDLGLHNFCKVQAQVWLLMCVNIAMNMKYVFFFFYGITHMWLGCKGTKLYQQPPKVDIMQIQVRLGKDLSTTLLHVPPRQTFASRREFVQSGCTTEHS